MATGGLLGSPNTDEPELKWPLSLTSPLSEACPAGSGAFQTGEQKGPLLSRTQRDVVLVIVLKPLASFEASDAIV